MTERDETETTRAATARLRRDDILNAGTPRPTGEYSVRKPRAASEPGKPVAATLVAHTTPDGHVQLSINGQTAVLATADARALASLIMSLLR